MGLAILNGEEWPVLGSSGRPHIKPVKGKFPAPSVIPILLQTTTDKRFELASRKRRRTLAIAVALNPHSPITVCVGLAESSCE
jgi:hypothetical protein